MYNVHPYFSLKTLGKKCALYKAKYSTLSRLLLTAPTQSPHSQADPTRLLISRTVMLPAHTFHGRFVMGVYPAVSANNNRKSLKRGG